MSLRPQILPPFLLLDTSSSAQVRKRCEAPRICPILKSGVDKRIPNCRSYSGFGGEWQNL
jgi:hypothetical protein